MKMSLIHNNIFNQRSLEVPLFNLIQQKRWMRWPGTRWGNRLAKLHRSIWEKPPPNVPSMETFSADRMKKERLDKIVPIHPVWQSRRSPIMGYKVGSMNLWDEWGERHLVSIIKVDRLEIMAKHTIPRNAMEGMKFGMGQRRLNGCPRSIVGESMKLKMGLKHRIHSRQCSSDAILPVKHLVSVRHFTPGQWVMVGGFTRARGFQGIKNIPIQV